MIVLSPEIYQEMQNRAQRFTDSINGNVQDSQINHIDIGDGGRVVIKGEEVRATAPKKTAPPPPPPLAEGEEEEQEEEVGVSSTGGEDVNMISAYDPSTYLPSSSLPSVRAQQSTYFPQQSFLPSQSFLPAGSFANLSSTAMPTTPTRPSPSVIPQRMQTTQRSGVSSMSIGSPSTTMPFSPTVHSTTQKSALKKSQPGVRPARLSFSSSSSSEGDNTRVKSVRFNTPKSPKRPKRVKTPKKTPVKLSKSRMDHTDITPTPVKLSKSRMDHTDIAPTNKAVKSSQTTPKNLRKSFTTQVNIPPSPGLSMGVQTSPTRTTAAAAQTSFSQTQDAVRFAKERLLGLMGQKSLPPSSPHVYKKKMLRTRKERRESHPPISTQRQKEESKLRGIVEKRLKSLAELGVRKFNVPLRMEKKPAPPIKDVRQKRKKTDTVSSTPLKPSAKKRNIVVSSAYRPAILRKKKQREEWVTAKDIAKHKDKHKGVKKPVRERWIT